MNNINIPEKAKPENNPPDFNFLTPRRPTNHMLGPPIPFADQGNRKNVNFRARELTEKKENNSISGNQNTTPQNQNQPQQSNPAVRNLMREIDNLKADVNGDMKRVMGRHDGLIDFLMRKVITLENEVNSICAMRTIDEIRKKNKESKPRKVRKEKSSSDTEEF